VLDLLLPLLPEGLRPQARQLHEAHLASMAAPRAGTSASVDEQHWSLAAAGNYHTADQLGLYEPSARTPFTAWLAIASLHGSATRGPRWHIEWRVMTLLARIGPDLFEPLTVFLPLFPGWATAGILRGVDTVDQPQPFTAPFLDAVADCLLSASAHTRKGAYHLLARRGREGEAAVARLRARTAPADAVRLDQRLSPATSQPKPSGTLAGALAALERGDDAGAVSELLAVWGTRRLRVVEPWILMLSESVTPIELPHGLAAEERERAWAAQWLTAPLQRSQLLLIPWPPNWRLGQLRIGAMLEGPDPRAPEALIALYGAYSSGTSYPFWRAAARVLGEQGDARHVAAAVRLARTRVRAGPSAFRALVRGEPVSARSATIAPEPEEELLLDRIAQRVQNRRLSQASRGPSLKDLEALLAAVYADPDSDEARAVYADALTAANNPRGEFIHLQLEIARRSTDTAPLERAAKVLLNKYGDRWVDGVDRGLLKAGRVFHRGFLTRGFWGEVGTTMSHPAWRLVETFCVAGYTPTPIRALCEADHLPGLRALYGMNASLIPELFGTRYPAQLTHLGLIATPTTLPPAHRFPNVRHLSLVAVMATRFSEETLRAWPKVQTWTLHNAHEQVGAMTGWRAPAAVTSVTNTLFEGGLGPDPAGWTATLTQSADGELRCVQLRWSGGSEWERRRLIPLLRGLPALQSLIVYAPRSLTAEERGAAHAEMARLNGVWAE
jgi:uncharacterized protein (TIGR02996 family)